VLSIKRDKIVIHNSKKADPLMPYEEYINSIKFRFIPPQTKLFRGYARIFHFFQRLGLDIEILNTYLPRKIPGLKDLNTISKMSSYAMGAIINQAVSEMENSLCFVNVGVWHGYSFLAGLLNNGQKNCVGVDNFSEFNGPKKEFLRRFNLAKGKEHNFYEMDYRDYFTQKHSKEIGFYIYDGEHSYRNQYEGLKVAEPYFSKGCLVMVDDTNKLEARQATLDFIKESKNEYEVIFDKKTFHNGHPTWWNGVMVFRKIS